MTPQGNLAGTRYPEKVNRWLKSVSGCSLLDFCKKFGYYSTAIKVMRLRAVVNPETQKREDPWDAINKDSELKYLFGEFSKDSNAVSRKGGNRLWIEYFQDLTTGWVIEDLFLEHLRSSGIDIALNGRDQKRQYLISSVTQEADFRVTIGGIERKVEFSSEINNILEENGFMEKRAPALYSLWKKKCIWIFLDLLNGKYVLVDFAVEPIKLHLRAHNTTKCTWTKDVHRYWLAENNKLARPDKLLVAELLSLGGESIEDKEQPHLVEIEDEDSPPQKWSIGGELKKSSIIKPSSKSPAASSPKVVQQTPPPPPKPSIPPKQAPTPKPVKRVVRKVEVQDFGDDDFV